MKIFDLALLALIYAAINYRGAQEWADAQRELKAKGESLEWPSFIPPPVKDDENLAFAPLFVRELNYRTDPQTGRVGFGPYASRPTDLNDMPYGRGGKPAGMRFSGWNLARHTDLATYAQVYDQAHQLSYPQPGDPIAGALAGIAPYNAVMDELARAAAERPVTRFPVDWETENPFGVALPQNNLQQLLVSALRLRASIEVAGGQADAALGDVELALRLGCDLRTEPTLVAYLVEIACLNLILTPIWEGLADHRWSAAELERLQAGLQGFNLLADYQHAIRGERASGGVRGIDYLSTHLGELPGIVHAPSEAPASETLSYQRMGPFVPQGWFDRNKATMARMMQEYYVEGVDPRAHRVFPAKAAAAEVALTKLSSHPECLFVRLALPTYASISQKAARMQVGLDEAAVACAIERFALDHVGQYPESLNELAPAYMHRVPTDVVSGEAMHYGKTPDGRYCLYEVGWNGRDEGGKVFWQSGGRQLDNELGDWVWQYAEFPAPK